MNKDLLFGRIVAIPTRKFEDGKMFFGAIVREYGADNRLISEREDYSVVMELPPCKPWWRIW